MGQILTRKMIKTQSKVGLGPKKAKMSQGAKTALVQREAQKKPKKSEGVKPHLFKIAKMQG